MDKIKAVIIDDEINTREFLEGIINAYVPDVELLGTAANISDGLKLIEETKPELLFLDIEMPGGTGFNLASKLTYKPYIVFVTAHQHYAIKAIKAEAEDYLLKPVDVDDLMACIEKIKSKIKNAPVQVSDNKNNDKKSLVISVRDGLVYFIQKDILSIEADGAYSYIYMRDGIKHTVSKNLREIGEGLDMTLFFRCHASYIINLYEVRKVQKGDNFRVELTSGHLVDVSRKYKEELLQMMDKIHS
jgi:two-component system, LytTR family, response regulator